MLIDLSDKDREPLYQAIGLVRELTCWNIDNDFISALQELSPLRYDKKVVGQYEVRYGDREFLHTVSVASNIQIESGGSSRASSISSTDVPDILPLSDKIVDAVTRNRQEVGLLMYLRKQFVKPSDIDLSAFIDISQLKGIYLDSHGNTLKTCGVSQILMSVMNPSMPTVKLIDDVHVHEPYLSMADTVKVSDASIDIDWLFVGMNYDLLLEAYSSVPEWYKKTYEKQLKIREAILKIRDTFKMEKRLLQ